jgi:hypothetical protein
MTAIKNSLLAAGLSLVLPVLAHAAPTDAARYERRCQSPAPLRTVKPQGSMLWGTRRDWNTEKGADERGSVLVSASLAAPLALEGGHLTAVSATSGAQGPAAAGARVVGTVLKGKASDGASVEIALCGAEPSPEDPDTVWYRIEAWNALSQEWENPCVAVGRVSEPRALVVGGVWDASGAHQDAAGQITFACENGAIAKCIRWGYKPWASVAGRSLDALHQACTRMARADYCGNGRSHTHENTAIDMYDRLGVLSRTTESSAEWDVARASFEAAWAPDGATCLARTRDGRALEPLLQECPGRFRTDKALALSQGDRCAAWREDVSPETALVRNLSYGFAPGAAAPGKAR